MEKASGTIAIPQDASRRITALRFLLSVLVVFIHNNYTDESVAEALAEHGTVIVFNQSAFGKWTQLLISQGIARCAVPLFFMFSAFLQAKKAEPYGVLLKKRARSLLVPFILWTAMYVFYYSGVKIIVAHIAPHLLAHPNDTAAAWTPLDWFHHILGYEIKGDGTFELPGAAYHFWFVRDLIILTVLSPLLQSCIKRIPAGFFMAAGTIYLTKIYVYFVEPQALFFYVAGLYWGMYDIPVFEKADAISWGESIGLFLLSFLFENLFSGAGTTIGHFRVIFSCILFLKLSAVIVSHKQGFAVASCLSGFSFFLYAIHTPALNGIIIAKAWLHFFPMRNGFFCLFEYFGATVLTIAAGTGIGIALSRICPPLFSLLTGGRGRRAD